eukprot:3047603-Rhodomonas_salina.3
MEIDNSTRINPITLWQPFTRTLQNRVVVKLISCRTICRQYKPVRSPGQEPKKASEKDMAELTHPPDPITTIVIKVLLPRDSLFSFCSCSHGCMFVKTAISRWGVREFVLGGVKAVDLSRSVLAWPAADQPRAVLASSPTHQQQARRHTFSVDTSQTFLSAAWLIEG